MPNNTEMIRQALDELTELKSRVDNLVKQIDQYELLKALNRVTALEQQAGHLSAKTAETEQLREQVAVLKEQIAELKKAREQTDNRVWNVLMIAVGAVLSLLGGVVVQLVAFAIKK